MDSVNKDLLKISDDEWFLQFQNINCIFLFFISPDIQIMINFR